MPFIYHEDDGDQNDLSGRQVSIIGYGNLGRPLALNLRDSGINVLVGTRGEDSREQAREDGVEATTIEDAVRRGQIIFMLLPDEVMPAFYLEQVSPYLKRDDMLVFGSAYNVAFGFIEAPAFVDVGLLAPRLMGAAVRERYESGEGFCCFVSVGQDASGQAWRRLLGLARAAGALRGGAIEVSFEQEAELDLFTQQVLLPVMQHVIQKAAQLLISRGYPPEAVLTELYLSGEFSLFLRQAEQKGLLPTLKSGSLTSQYGTFSRLDRFNDLKLERLMEVTLDEIHTGRFAQEWAKEAADGYRRLNSLVRSQEDLELSELEQQALDLLGRSDDFDA
ncbi:MAG: NAD(P)-binding domain-containing protein [Chloroflexi bacterium]|nr:NAD(P)-binding domain-containing protein [Chloroflexota bacterium]